jgi:hypothetical protein
MPNVHAEAPAFDRLNYFYGQLLGAGDFLTEQRYFREKLKLHNRCLHGFGVVCGLDVEVPAPTTPPSTTASLQIDPGFALDPDGNELLVRHPIAIPDVLALLSPADRASLPTSGTGVSLWISIAYHERGIEPNRPVLPDACAASPACLFGKTREDVCVQATLTAPVIPTGTCCSDAPHHGPIVLARIDGILSTTTAIDPKSIALGARTTLGVGTTITGVSWQHGYTYTAADASTLLGGSVGLVFQFSAPVYSGETSPQGTLEVLRITAAGAITAIPGALTWTAAASPPNTATAVTFNPSAAPTLASGDRIAITLRTATMLDSNCEPITGANIGGRVALLPNGVQGIHQAATGICTSPPGGGTWQTGAGASFESWIFVQ